jgi:uncharacterized protein YyaL (SSP411 family)
MLTEKELAALPPDGGPDYNRLVFEKSPYLLQHARNPVDWYPWGEEAFEKAAAEDKPVFLSIGYSTCHWCHVMEKESFEAPEVAALMNGAFVCVKVDREERPDIDNVYMNVCQAMTGGGGWPLTILMTPDKRPFFAATYLPKDTKFGRTGIVDLVPRVLSAWNAERSQIDMSAGRITSALREAAARPAGGDLGEEILGEAFGGLESRYDAVRGGFGSAPKFPTPHNLLFLLRYWARSGDERALEMVEFTLSSMRRGGIYDHVGYGFHRYSTDREWLLPHFEKMLYDQAMMAMAYIEAYVATGDGGYADTAREIFEYVMRDMTSPEGAFYSAEDADSEGEEGKYYLWTADEVRGILGPEDGALFAQAFNISDGGNYEDETGGPGGERNILHLKRPLEDIAAESAIDEVGLRGRLEESRVKLLEARRVRVPPYKDDKVLADWNGLMIASLAKGAQALNEPSYARAAAAASDFVLERMAGDRGRVLHRYRGGEAAVPGFLDDYAFMIWGLIELYEATFETRFLESALDLTDVLVTDFWDEDNWGFFFYGDSSEDLLVRDRTIYDGAVPSGNSVAALCLLRLARATASADLEERGTRTLRAFSDDIARSPAAYTQALAAVDFAVGPSYEIVLAGDPGEVGGSEMLKALRAAYVPNKVVLFRPSNERARAIVKLAEFTERQLPVEGKMTAYVCLNYACVEPVTTPERLLKLLRER